MTFKSKILRNTKYLTLENSQPYSSLLFHVFISEVSLTPSTRETEQMPIIVSVESYETLSTPNGLLTLNTLYTTHNGINTYMYIYILIGF